MTRCPKCGEDNPERARFCLACGESLGEGAGAAGRKTVTVVFTDIVGSTALSEGLDPEAFRYVMTRYYQTMTGAIKRHGGRAEKFIGDAIMAVFGVPQLHEDDALRAVRAAVEMRGSLDFLNRELELQRGVSIELRIGVGTGEVLVEPGAPGEGSIVGGSVNLAARLQEAAAPGEILIARETQQLVKNAIRSEPVSDLELKGIDGVTEAYRLSEVITESPEYLRRSGVPFVGRERERKVLQQAFERARDERTSHLFTLLGVPGVGKSRLVHEFLASIGSEARIVRGRCLSYGEGITFWPIVEMVREAAGLGIQEEPKSALDKIGLLIGDEERAEQITELVGQAVGLAESAAGSQEIFWGIRRFFESLARDRPLVAVFDDIHWAEPTFLDLIDHVADWVKGVPVLIVCNARPELLETRKDWAGGKLNATTILLEGLSDEAGSELIENLLAPARPSDETKAEIVRATDGNPLFVEELLTTLIDDGRLRLQGDRWQASGDFSQITAPPSIHSLLAARLERLPLEERQVVERAAVIGRVFTSQAVSNLVSKAARKNLDTHLRALVSKEIIRPDRTQDEESDAYRFRHLLIRDTAYRGLPKRDRATLHERFASYMEEAAGPRFRELEEIVAYHLEQAHTVLCELSPADEKARELATRAVGHLSAAGRRAYARGDIGATTNLLKRAVDLLGETDPDRVALLPDLGAALAQGGNPSEAETVLKEAVALAREIDNSAYEQYALIELADLKDRAGKQTSFEDVSSVATAAIEVFEAVGDDLGLARAWDLMAEVDWNVCRAASAEKAIRRVLHHAERAGAVREIDEASSFLVWIAVEGPRPVTEAIELCNEIRGRALGRSETSAVMGLARLLAMQGNFDAAKPMLQTGLRNYEEMGRMVALGGASLHAAGVEILAGDMESAEHHLRRGNEILLKVGDRYVLSTMMAYLGHLVFGKQEFDEASELARKAAEMATPGDVTTEVLVRSLRGKLLAQAGSFEEADLELEKALNLSEAGDFLVRHANTLRDLALIKRLEGRLDDAQRALEGALEIYRRKGNTAAVAVAEETSTPLV